MKLRNPRLIRWTAALAAWVARVWLGSMHVEIDTRRSGPQPIDPHVTRCIYAFWHESQLFSVWFRRVPAHILISQHADGELIAQVAQRLGAGVVRGSSRRGGTAAVLEMLRVEESSHLVITPDGPSGPRRVVKPGIIFLASQLGLPIVPVGVGFTRAWRAPSWDRFAVPMPFSGMKCVAGELVYIPNKLDGDQREEFRKLIEQKLQAATAMAEAWANGELPPADCSQDQPLAA